MSAGPTEPAIRGYEILGLLGTGGLGAVWRARRPDGTLVAVKVVEPHHPVDAATTERIFRREALATLNLDHPGIVRALDAGRAGDGRPYIAFELLEGPTLGAAVRARGPLPEAEVVVIGRAAAAALDHAHRHGLAHGDLSPRNILLAPGGARLLDFGLLRELAAGHDGSVWLTQGFTAPETADGAPPDPASDLYSLGMTLAFAALGRTALDSSSMESYLAGARGGDLRLPGGAAEPPLSPGFRAVVERLGRRDPSRRYPSAAELRLDLDALRAGETPLGAALAGAKARMAGRLGRRGFLAGVGAGVLAAVAVAAVLVGRYGRDEAPPPAPAPAPAAAASSPDPLDGRVEALRVLLGREPVDYGAARALAAEIEAAGLTEPLRSSFGALRADLDRRWRAAAAALAARKGEEARAALAAGDRAAWREILTAWPAGFEGAPEAVAARKEAERAEAAAKRGAEGAERVLGESEGSLATLDPSAPGVPVAVERMDADLRAIEEDPAAAPEQRRRAGELRAKAGTFAAAAGEARLEGAAKEAWRALASGLARGGDGAAFRAGLSDLVTGFRGKPPGGTGASLADLDLRIRRADAAVAHALLPTAGRAWARARGDRIVVETRAEVQPMDDSLVPWEQNFPPLPSTPPEDALVTLFLADDVVRTAGDREDGFAWSLARGSFHPDPLAGAGKGTVNGLLELLYPPASRGFPGPRPGRWFTMAIFLGLRPTDAAVPVNPGDSVSDAWEAFLAKREGRPHADLPARPAANPARQAALDALLADDLPGAWTRSGEAVEKDPLDPEVAVLRARILLLGARPLPTTAVLLLALCEARRGWDLDPALAAGPGLAAEAAFGLLDRPPGDEHMAALLARTAEMACEASLRLGRETPRMLVFLGERRRASGDLEGARKLLRRARDAGAALPPWAEELLR